jgi:hypothetical protein
MDDDSYADDDDDSYADDDTTADPLAIVLINGQDGSNYESDESMDFDDEFSYDDLISRNELPSLCSQSSCSRAESTIGNGDICTVICEASYVCDTDEDSSAATFTSHDDSVIDNIHQLDSGATNSFYNNPNITKLRVPIRMEQSVRRYLDDIVLDAPKVTGIMNRPSQNIATMIDVRQRFSGTIQSIRKEDMYLGMSNTRFTLYRLSPYFNRAGIPGGTDKFNTLCDAFTNDIPGAFLYFDHTDTNHRDYTEHQDFHRGSL